MSGGQGPQELFHDDGLSAALDPQSVLPNLIRIRAVDAAETPFLVETGGLQQTYSEFHRSALRWGGALWAAGVGISDRVACLLEACIDAHHVWLGSAYIGAYDAPLNPEYRGPLLVHVLNTARARIVVTDVIRLPFLAEVIDELNDLELVIICGPPTPVTSVGFASVVHVSDFLADAPETADYRPLQPEEISSLMFTSGTTGPSKGVLVRWGQITGGTELSPLRYIGQDSRAYSPYPVYHLSGKLPLVSAARMMGRVVISKRFSTSAVWSDIQKHGCTTMGMIGSIAQFVVGAEFDAEASRSLRYMTMSPVLPNVDSISKRLGAVVGTAYGSTEGGWPLLNREATDETYLSCGKLRPGYRLRVVDGEGNDLGPGEVGELLIYTDYPALMSAGYFELPEKNEESFKDGWFRTGDAFRYDEEGRYYFLDRIKDAIRRRGENISSFEVELYVDQHPEVLRVAAVAHPSEFGEDEVKVFVIRKEGSSLTPEAMHSWMTERMPRFMVPRFIQFVDSLPLTETGKVRKVELRAREHSSAWDAMGSRAT